MAAKDHRRRPAAGDCDLPSWSLDRERGGLVRLCARLTGDLDAAEDLAQETLFEAWRNRQKLRGADEPAERAQWLAAIARNVCLRWTRRHGRELRWRTGNMGRRPSGAEGSDAGGGRSGSGGGGGGGRELLAADLGEWLPDRFDLEVELERHELVQLLDRAMALLPPETRRVLVERYVAESPLAETALRLGLSEGAVAMRLQRGKLALRRLLVTEFWGEAAAYGLLAEADGAWRETRLWCPLCPARRLVGYLDHRRGTFLLRCPTCTAPGQTYERTRDPVMLARVRGYRAAYAQVLAFVAGYYQRSQRQNPMPCPSCGHPVRVRGSYPQAWHGVYYRCERCGSGASSALGAVVLGLPEGQRFRREHPRIRLLPQRAIEAAGRPAYVTGYESVDRHARLEVVSTRDTCELIAVHCTPR